MLNRRCALTLAAVLLLGPLALLPGCDWLKSSGTAARSSPYLSNLAISPSSVLCDGVYSVSFQYDDPQGDISQVQIFLQLEGGTDAKLEAPPWPESQSRQAGVVTFPLSFACDSRGGRWLVTVQVYDDLGHASNVLSGSVNLSSAG